MNILDFALQEEYSVAHDRFVRLLPHLDRRVLRFFF
jgi:hypothetical protein